MDLIKKIFLIFALVLTALLFNCANCNEVVNIDCSYISSFQSQKQILLNPNSELSIDVVQNSNATINNRRNHSENSTNDNVALLKINEFNNVSSYLYNMAYLEDKNELALLFLLHQIQPNAP